MTTILRPIVPTLDAFKGITSDIPTPSTTENKILASDIKETKKRVSNPKDTTPAPKRARISSTRSKKVPKKETAKKIQMLIQYGQSQYIGPYLKGVGYTRLTPEKLNNMDPKTIDKLFHEIESILMNKGQSDLLDQVIGPAMQQLEAAVHEHTEYKVKGTTAQCWENDHWRFLLERIKIRHGLMRKLDPLSELTLVTFQTAKLMHITNSCNKPKVDIDASIDASNFQDELQ